MRVKLQLSLRSRIAGTILALVAVAGISLATFAHLADERIEVSTRYDLLSEELTHYEHRLQRDPGAEPLKSARLRIYRSVDLHELPRSIAALKPGSHYPVRWSGLYLHVLVRDGDFGRLWITYDVTPQRMRERVAITLLILGLTATVLITAWAAYALSSRLVGPINRLAHRLTAIDPGKRQVRVASEFAGNELEPIARSVDSFLERLDGFVEREQSFTATASHELRTPLAVIVGAVELLNEQTRSQPSAQKALGRIQRALREMSEFTDALLTLSREDAVERATQADCDVTAVLTRVADDQRAIATGKDIQLTLDSHGSVRVPAPESMVAMVIGNLVRNAIQHGQDPKIECTLTGRELQVTNVGHIEAPAMERVFDRSFTTSPGGHGMGLYLAQRICQRYGWNIGLDQVGGCVVAKVRF
jgi:signal transduction histidine kinase